MVKDYSTNELIAVVLSRQLQDDWNGVTPYSPIIAAACMLARRSSAPGLTFWCGTLGINPEPERLYRTGTDPRNLSSVEGIGDFYDVFEYGETRCDFMFYSGLQIDRYGNANNVRTGGPGTSRPLVVGGGQANTSHPVVDGRIFLFAPRHTPEIFVERVDFISVTGFINGPDDRHRLALPGGGPALCVSELAVMDFNSATGCMRLKSVHPRVTVEEVRARTGFELDCTARIAETKPPTDDELTILHDIDRDGILREV